MSVDALVRGWDGDRLVLRHDGATDAVVLVGIHSTALGPAMGGTRMKPYPTLEDAIRDVCRLAAAMTLKQAAADLPFGGGKAVIAVPEVPARGSDVWRGLFERYGDLIEDLGGAYVTAADMNTGTAEMDVIADRTSHVLGRSPECGGSGDPGHDTAVGVFHGIRAACAQAFGADDLAGRTVVVQGAGSVGRTLVGLLADAGAEVLVADVDETRAAAAAAAGGATVVAAADAVRTPCDVLAPCATGGLLSEETIPGLKCRVIAGSANNQLATPEDAGRLHEAGILYAPDYVVNAGGVIHLAGYETLGWDAATVGDRLVAIGRTLAEVFDAAARDGVTPSEAADRHARARIEAARPAPG